MMKECNASVTGGVGGVAILQPKGPKTYSYQLYSFHQQVWVQQPDTGQDHITAQTLFFAIVTKQPRAPPQKKTTAYQISQAATETGPIAAEDAGMRGHRPHIHVSLTLSPADVAPLNAGITRE